MLKITLKAISTLILVLTQLPQKVQAYPIERLFVPYDNGYQYSEAYRKDICPRIKTRSTFFCQPKKTKRFLQLEQQYNQRHKLVLMLQKLDYPLAVAEGTVQILYKENPKAKPVDYMSLANSVVITLDKGTPCFDYQKNILECKIVNLVTRNPG